MKRITYAEAASRWAKCEPVLVRCTGSRDAWAELSDDYGLDVFRSEIHEFAIRENMIVNGKTIDMPNTIVVRDMSIHDDASNASNVVMHGEYWYPFEPVSALTVIGPIFRSHDINFMGCAACDGLLDPWDVAHDDFGELRCAWCGSNQLELLI